MNRADLWFSIQSLQEENLITAKDLIAKATVEIALSRADEMQARGNVIDDPTRLDTFGASYLHANGDNNEAFIWRIVP